jgi:hypothetical protein
MNNQVGMFSLALASATSLTVGSTRTPTLAMPSAFLWPVLVPFSRCAPYGAG